MNICRAGKAQLELCADIFMGVTRLDVAYSICGRQRLDEFLRSLTSLLLFATLPRSPPDKPGLHIHVITDVAAAVRKVLPGADDVHYHLHKPDQSAATLFAPCSTQRLYLYSHPGFTDIDEVLYLDIDTLWLAEPTFAWAQFQGMRQHGALFGMAEETSDKNEAGNWYKGGHSGGLPYHGQRGLNAGILLLSLDRLREANFGRDRDRIIRHFSPKKQLPLGDQDVLNAYLHRHPHHVHVLPCTMNFRSDSACYGGFPIILHGNRGLKDDLNSTYSSVYRLMGTLSGPRMRLQRLRRGRKGPAKRPPG